MGNPAEYMPRRKRSRLPYLLAHENSSDSGRHGRRRQLTVDEFASREYLPYIRQHLKSWRTSEQMLRRHVSPAFGQRKLADIRRSEVLDWQMGLLRDGFTISTSNRSLAALSSLYAYAEHLGYVPIGLSPCYKISPLPSQKRAAYMAPPEKVAEMMALLKKSDAKQAKAIRLIALTGARKGEILRARWEDIDWENRRLRSVRDMHGEQRWLELPVEAVEILRGLHEENNCDWIFPGRKPDKPLSDLFRFWDKLRNELGIPQMKIEDLRYNS